MNYLLPHINNDNDLKIKILEIPTPFPVGPINLYVLFGEKITLVDTGPKTELAWKSLIYQLNKNGLRIKDIDQVVLTHHHVDHSGLLAILQQHHPKIKTFAHNATIPWVELRSDVVKKMVEFYKELYIEHGLSIDQIDDIKKFHAYFDQYTDSAKVDEILTNNDLLEGNNDWKIIHNPGHAQGHISLYHEETKTLIAGDHLIEHTASGIFIEPHVDVDQPRPKSLVDYKRSLEEINKLDVKMILSGHGKIITEPEQIVEQQLIRLNQRLSKVKSYIKSEPLTVNQIMQSIYSNRFESNLPLYFSEILGALELLENQGEVVSIKENNLIKFSLAQ